jgi:hypothetical protein
MSILLPGNIIIEDFSVNLLKITSENPPGFFTEYYLVKNGTTIISSNDPANTGWYTLVAETGVTYAFWYGQVTVPATIDGDQFLYILENWVYDTSKVQKNGTYVAQNQSLNFIEGANITLTITDDYPNKRTNIQIDASGGGGGGTVTSVGLSVPTPANPAYSVTGSPVIAAGTLGIVANGAITDYVRGDGSLAVFPTITDQLVKVRVTDTTPDYLNSKVIDGDGLLKLINNPAGNETLELYVEYAPMVLVACKNATASLITKGTPVYITGTVGATQVLEIAPADASTSAKMPAIGLAYSDLGVAATGHVIISGLLTLLTTDPIDGLTPTVNQTLYVRPAGGLTLTKPTGTNLIQEVGNVSKVDAGLNGGIAVSVLSSALTPAVTYTGRQADVYIDSNNEISTVATFSGFLLMGG